MSNLFTIKEMPKLRPIPASSRFFPFKPLWEVVEDWTVGDVTVPKGFKTDLDSVSRIPFVFSFLKGRIRAAAVLHDYHYTYGDIPRKEADLELRENAIREGNGATIASLLYYGVNVFGGLFYMK